MIYPIKTKRTALLIIDVQNEYSDSTRPLFVEDNEKIINNINKISVKFRENGSPVFLIKHEHDSSGNDVGRMGDFSDDEVFTAGEKPTSISKGLIVDDNDIVVTKARYSAFVNTKLESYLKTLDVDTLVVVGFMTSYCSVTTTRHGHDLDYKMIFINDGNSAPVFGDLGFGDVTLEEIKRVVSTMLAGGVAEVINTKDVISRL